MLFCRLSHKHVGGSKAKKDLRQKKLQAHIHVYVYIAVDNYFNLYVLTDV